MKYFLLLALLGMGWGQDSGLQINFGTGEFSHVTPDCPKGMVCSGTTTGKLAIDKFPENQPLTEALNKALNAYIEKHCRVVISEGQLKFPESPTIGQIKCDQ